MKKFLSVLLMVTFVLSLAACGRDTDDPDPDPDPDPDNGDVDPDPDPDPDITPPVLEGVVDVEIYVDSEFDPLEGVTAIDDVDGDITDDIVVTGSVNVSSVGTYFLRYTIEDSSGNRTEKTRFVTVVINPDDLGDEMVPNGDFSLGWAIWTTTTGLEGGTGDFEVVNGELQITINSVSGGMWEPRLENIGITFEQGKIYEVSFDARALAPRSIHVQIGELLDGAPWFTDFKPAVPVIIDLDETMTTYSFTFMMDLETNENGAVIFEFGTVSGGVGTDNLLTTVFLDNVMIEEVDEYVDVTPPVISGANDRTIVEGTDFDPLAGITVIDDVDGEITLTMENVEGTVDVNTVGEYTLTYTVSDEAGNETVVTRVITVIEAIDEDLPKEADYGWRIFLNDWEGTEGSAEVVDGEYVLTLTEINASENWNIQIIQDSLGMGSPEEEGTMQLEAGRTYRVTFDARASVAGDITLAIGHPIGGWNEYFLKDDIAITQDMQTFEIEFTLDAEGDYSTLAQFKLEMGLLFAGETGEQYFVLDNVMIEVLEDTEFVDAELIVNGVFEAEVSEGSVFGWRAFVNDWDGSAGHVEFFNGYLRFMIESINTSQNWQLQIIQDTIAFGEEEELGTLQLEAGATYRFTFDARSSLDGDFEFVLGTQEGGWTPYYAETLSATREWETFVVEFTLDAAEDFSKLAQFKLEMGLLFAGEDGPQYFDLDNVVVEILVDNEFVDADLIFNGDFTMPAPTEEDNGEDEEEIVTGPLGWRAFVNDWEGSVGGFEVIDGELVFTLTAINTSENWNLQIIQDTVAFGDTEEAGTLPFEDGATYRVTFDARASVEGEAELVIGHPVGGWTPYFGEMFNVTTEMQTFTFEFTLDDEEMDYDVLAQFKIEMGLLFTGLDAPQYFVLDNVTIEILDDDTFVDADLIVNGDFSEVVEIDDEDEDDEEEVVTGPLGWRAFVNDWEGSAGGIEVVDGELVFNITAINTYANWNLQIIQDAFALGTGADNEGSLAFAEGETYRVTFEARASVEGEAEFLIGHAGGGWTPYFGEMFNVTTEMQTFTFEFTLDDEEMDYDVLAQFKIEMGLLYEGLDAPQYFVLDNVTIEILDDDTFVDADLIVNGDFSEESAEE